MKLYRICSVKPLGEEFGYFLTSNYTRIVGWCENEDCPIKSIKERVFPSTLEFTGGKCGDMLSDLNLRVFRLTVALELRKRFGEIEIHPVNLHRQSKSPCGLSEGDLCEVYSKVNVPWNPEVSTLRVRWKCDTCKQALYEVLGVALPNREERVGDRWVSVGAQGRTPGMGVLIPTSILRGIDCFRFGDTFEMCTERAKGFIEKRGWTNIQFQEYGETI